MYARLLLISLALAMSLLYTAVTHAQVQTIWGDDNYDSLDNYFMRMETWIFSNVATVQNITVASYGAWEVWLNGKLAGSRYGVDIPQSNKSVSLPLVAGWNRLVIIQHELDSNINSNTDDLKLNLGSLIPTLTMTPNPRFNVVMSYDVVNSTNNAQYESGWITMEVPVKINGLQWSETGPVCPERMPLPEGLPWPYSLINRGTGDPYDKVTVGDINWNAEFPAVSGGSIVNLVDNQGHTLSSPENIPMNIQAGQEWKLCFVIKNSGSSAWVDPNVKIKLYWIKNNGTYTWVSGTNPLYQLSDLVKEETLSSPELASPGVPGGATVTLRCKSKAPDAAGPYFLKVVMYNTGTGKCFGKAFGKFIRVLETTKDFVKVKLVTARATSTGTPDLATAQEWPGAGPNDWYMTGFLEDAAKNIVFYNWAAGERPAANEKRFVKFKIDLTPYATENGLPTSSHTKAVPIVHSYSFSYRYDREPKIECVSGIDQNLYAGYPTCVFVDAYNEDGWTSLGKAQLVIYSYNSSTNKYTPLDTLEITDEFTLKFAGTGDSGNIKIRQIRNRIDGALKYTMKLDDNRKRYFFKFAPRFEWVDNQPEVLAVRAYVYFKNSTKAAGVFPKLSSNPLLVGKVINKIAIRPYTSDSDPFKRNAWCFFTDAHGNSRLLFPNHVEEHKPQANVVRAYDPQSSDYDPIYLTGSFYFDDGGIVPYVDGPVWRISKFAYDSSVVDSRPVTRASFGKLIKSALMGLTSPQSVQVSNVNFNGEYKESLGTAPNEWEINFREQDGYRHICPTGTKYFGRAETWWYFPGGIWQFDWNADENAQIWIDGDLIAERYNQGPGQPTFTTLIRTPASGVELKWDYAGWHHIVVLWEERDIPPGGFLYKWNWGTMAASPRGIMRPYAVPLPNGGLTSENNNNGCGTVVVAERDNATGTKNTGEEAVVVDHVGKLNVHWQIADPGPPIVYSQQKEGTEENNLLEVGPGNEGGDHKLNFAVYSTYTEWDPAENKYVNRKKLRARSTDVYYLHVNHAPNYASGLRKIPDSTTEILLEPYENVEVIATTNPVLGVKWNDPNKKDVDSKTNGFHSSKYLKDYKTGLTWSASARTDFVGYKWIVSVGDIDMVDGAGKPWNPLPTDFSDADRVPAFTDINGDGKKEGWVWHRYPSQTYINNLSGDEKDTIEVSATDGTFAPALSNTNKLIESTVDPYTKVPYPLYHWSAWTYDEHGVIQNTGPGKKMFVIDLSPPEVVDIQVFYDRKEDGAPVRLDKDQSPFYDSTTELGLVENAHINHTITLWAYATDSVCFKTEKFQKGEFRVRPHREGDDSLAPDDGAPWSAPIPATLEKLDDQMPETHPDKRLKWHATWVIPEDAELTYYDVDFRIADPVGNLSGWVSEHTDHDRRMLAEKQFRVVTISPGNVLPMSPTKQAEITIQWNNFDVHKRAHSTIDHYLISFDEIAVDDVFDTRMHVAGGALSGSCTREVFSEGSHAVYVQAVDKIANAASTRYTDNVYGYERDLEGWRYYDGTVSVETKDRNQGEASLHLKVKKFYKEFNIGEGKKVTFSAWIKKLDLNKPVRLYAHCFKRSGGKDPILDPSKSNFEGQGGTYLMSFASPPDTNIKESAWVKYYLRPVKNADPQLPPAPADVGKPYFKTPSECARVVLSIESEGAFDVRIDKVGFASCEEVLMDPTAPQKIIPTVGIMDNHLNSGDSALFYGYWDGVEDMRGSAWADDQATFPTIDTAKILFSREKKYNGADSMMAVASGGESVMLSYFKNAYKPLVVEEGDRIKLYVYLDNYKVENDEDTIKTLVIGFNDGSDWNHQMIWGDVSNVEAIDKALESEEIKLASGFTRVYGGILPVSGEWKMLAVDASELGLGGRAIKGLFFAAQAKVKGARNNARVFLDYVDIGAGSGTEYYYPQLQVDEPDPNNPDKESPYKDLAQFKKELSGGKSYPLAGFSSDTLFDDTWLKANITTSAQCTLDTEIVFSGSLSVLLKEASHRENGYVDVAFPLPRKTDLPIKGGGICIWAYIEEYTGDVRLQEINVGLLYKDPGSSSRRAMSVAKFRHRNLSPKSSDFYEVQLQVSEAEIRANYNEYANGAPLYRVPLNGYGGSGQGRFTDVGRLPDFVGKNRYWFPLFIPTRQILPPNYMDNTTPLDLERIVVGVRGMIVRIDHIQLVRGFTNTFDFLGFIPYWLFEQKGDQTGVDIHSTDYTLDGSESVKIDLAGTATRRHVYIKARRDENNKPVTSLFVPPDGALLSIWFYIEDDPAEPEKYAPQEILVEFHTADAGNDDACPHRAYWGSDIIPVGTTVDCNEHRYMGFIPHERNHWQVALMSSSQLGLDGRAIDGIRVTIYGVNKKSRIYFDRFGLVGMVKHRGAGEKHCIFVWEQPDYVYYNMRVKAWDKVLNETDWSSSKYFRSADRTRPRVEHEMTPRLNYWHAYSLIKPYGCYYKSGTTLVEYTGEVDLSVTIDDVLSLRLQREDDEANYYDDQHPFLPKSSIGERILKIGGVTATKEVWVSLPMTSDPAPSMQYTIAQWQSDVEAIRMTPIGTQSVWLNDPTVIYTKARYYYGREDKPQNYLVRMLVFDDENNFTPLGEHDYPVDAVPGDIRNLRFYGFDRDRTIAADQSKTKDALGRYDITDNTIMFGVVATDSQGNLVEAGRKIRLTWEGSGVKMSMGKRIERVNYSPSDKAWARVGGVLKQVTRQELLDIYRDLWIPAPFFRGRQDNPYRLIHYGYEDVGTDETNILSNRTEITIPTGYGCYVDPSDPEDFKWPLCTDAVEMQSGAIEALFIATTHSQDKFFLRALSEDGSVSADSPYITVVPGDLKEMTIEMDPPDGVIRAEEGVVSLQAHGYDRFKSLEYLSPLIWPADGTEPELERRKKTYVEMLSGGSTSEVYFDTTLLQWIEYCTNEVPLKPAWVSLAYDRDLSDQATNSVRLRAELEDKYGSFGITGQSPNNTYLAGYKAGKQLLYAICAATEEVSAVVPLSPSVNVLVKDITSTYGLTRYTTNSSIFPAPFLTNPNLVSSWQSCTIEVTPGKEGYLGWRRNSVTGLPGEQIRDRHFDMNTTVPVLNSNGEIYYPEIGLAYVQVYDRNDQASDYEDECTVEVIVHRGEDVFIWDARDPLSHGLKPPTEKELKLLMSDTEESVVASGRKVIVTESGDRYHMPYCRYTWHQRGNILTTVERARALGKQPCTLCLGGEIPKFSRQRIIVSLENGSAPVYIAAKKAREMPDIVLKTGTYESGEVTLKYGDFFTQGPKTEYSKLKLRIHPNRLDTINFDPSCSSKLSPYPIAYNESYTFNARGYDYWLNEIEWIGYSSGTGAQKWLFTYYNLDANRNIIRGGTLAGQPVSDSILPAAGKKGRVLSAKLVTPQSGPDANLLMEVFAEQEFRKYLHLLGQETTEVARLTGTGFLALRNFNFGMTYPSVCQVLDPDMFDDYGSYVLTARVKSNRVGARINIGMLLLDENNKQVTSLPDGTAVNPDFRIVSYTFTASDVLPGGVNNPKWVQVKGVFKGEELSDLLKAFSNRDWNYKLMLYVGTDTTSSGPNDQVVVKADMIVMKRNN